MNMNVKKISLFIVLLVLILSAGSRMHAQMVKGMVVDAATNEPLIGATVVINETKEGVVTDLDGKFVLNKVKPGDYHLTAQYVTYKPQTIGNVKVEKGAQGKELLFKLESENEMLGEVTVVAKSNNERESALIAKQRNATVAAVAIGALEMSKKGIGDAKAAVSQMAGVSKQDGVKNVFVRGLGDRYNITLLNGFPIPSDDPEYKNIALDFFSSDMIQNVSVHKAFSGEYSGDVGGAIIDIRSRELFGKHELKLGVEGGVNSTVTAEPFIRQDGTNYFGFSRKARPSGSPLHFANSLDPHAVPVPMDHKFNFSVGNRWDLFDGNSPLSFLLIGSHDVAYNYTNSVVRNAVKGNASEPIRVYQDQVGHKWGINIGQLAMLNVNWDIAQRNNIAYNVMFIHNNNQYIGDYNGLQAEKYQDSESYSGFLRRQQANDNMLVVNQLTGHWQATDALKVYAGASYNVVLGEEPDRRENYLSKAEDGSYFFTGSNRQKRFFSSLRNSDVNAKLGATYQLKDRVGGNNSRIHVGYVGRIGKDHFTALEYNYEAAVGKVDLSNLQLQEHYWGKGTAGRYSVVEGEPNTYTVSKQIHGAFADASYEIVKGFIANVGLRVDKVNIDIDYITQSSGIGSEQINGLYFLPSLNLKYNLTDAHILRLSASKTYTLPQSKEIAPYQYVNVGFTSQGNPKILPSQNYNVDARWEFYPSANELISANIFYKRILNPIARVDKGNSAGLLEYDNVSKKADVAGIEVELRKQLLQTGNTEQGHKLSCGLSGSYIYTTHEILFTDSRPDRQMEGAAPFIVNADLSHSYRHRGSSLSTSLTFNYVSDRIHTIGSNGYNDIVEKGVATLNLISSFSWNKHWAIKVKAKNLLNPRYTLSRKFDGVAEPFIMEQYRKGIQLGLGVSYTF